MRNLMTDERKKYNQYNVEKSELWTSCFDEQEKIFQEMKDTYTARICRSYIPPNGQDIINKFNEIIPGMEMNIRHYNFHLFKYRLLLDIANEMKKPK
ncbi:unnamed protein product [Schistosoma spindalis]|nr:unnamed protein product [Schistosoma spindale]